MAPATVAKLSCEQCRVRKTKCDKESPCSACRNAGIDCTAVQRARLPRGRAVKSKKRSNKLESRLAQLESLIKQLESQVHDSPSNESRSPADQGSTRPPLDKLEKFVARDFWVELSDEVAGLRNTLEESSDDDAEIPWEPPKPFWGNPSDALLTGREPMPQYAKPLEPPSDHMRNTLLGLYQERVDGLFKVLHWPTAVADVCAQYPTRRTDTVPAPSSPSLRALEFAIYFLAVCSVSENECHMMLQSDKSVLIQRYRLATEVYISRGKFLYDANMMVLQAFVIYLLGVRVCKESALSWTLVALAVRVATALRLPATEAEGRSTLELEVCRRVWFCLGVLDSQTAFDRGFPPMTSVEDFASQPKIINDSQLSDRSIETARWDPFTDMSFSYVLQEATICLRKLTVPPKPVLAGEDPWADWTSKVQIIAAFEVRMKQHKAHISTSTKPLARFTEFSTEHISLNMHLLLRRPPYRRKDSPVPPWDDFDLLEATTSAMERVMRKAGDPVFIPYLWFSQSWVEWNALAVLLAELCTPRNDALTARAYNVAQLVFEQYKKDMAGPDSQMLWRPIARLMRRVRQIRGSESLSASEKSGSPENVSPPAYSTMGHMQQSTTSMQLQPMALDTQIADLALQQPSMTTITGVMLQPLNNASWYNTIGNLQPTPGTDVTLGGDLTWMHWDNFLDDMYAGNSQGLQTLYAGTG